MKLSALAMAAAAAAQLALVHGMRSGGSEESPNASRFEFIVLREAFKNRDGEKFLAQTGLPNQTGLCYTVEKLRSDVSMIQQYRKRIVEAASLSFVRLINKENRAFNNALSILKKCFGASPATDCVEKVDDPSLAKELSHLSKNSNPLLTAAHEAWRLSRQKPYRVLTQNDPSLGNVPRFFDEFRFGLHAQVQFRGQVDPAIKDISQYQLLADLHGNSLLEAFPDAESLLDPYICDRKVVYSYEKFKEVMTTAKSLLESIKSKLTEWEAQNVSAAENPVFQALDVCSSNVAGCDMKSLDKQVADPQNYDLYQFFRDIQTVRFHYTPFAVLLKNRIRGEEAELSLVDRSASVPSEADFNKLVRLRELQMNAKTNPELQLCADLLGSCPAADGSFPYKTEPVDLSDAAKIRSCLHELSCGSPEQKTIDVFPGGEATGNTLVVEVFLVGDSAPRKLVKIGNTEAAVFSPSGQNGIAGNTKLVLSCKDRPELSKNIYAAVAEYLKPRSPGNSVPLTARKTLVYADDKDAVNLVFPIKSSVPKSATEYISAVLEAMDCKKPEDELETRKRVSSHSPKVFAPKHSEHANTKKKDRFVNVALDLLKKPLKPIKKFLRNLQTPP